MKILAAMDDGDENVDCNNLLSRYSERPIIIEDLTLAEFAAYYEKVSRKKNPTVHNTSNEPIDKITDEDGVFGGIDDLPPAERTGLY